jgi:hypothetical protein
MRKTVISRLVDLANIASGKSSNDIGYLVYYSLGWPRSPRIYFVATDWGGLMYSDLNGDTPQKTCNALRGHIMKIHAEKES